MGCFKEKMAPFIPMLMASHLVVQQSHSLFLQATHPVSMLVKGGDIHEPVSSLFSAREGKTHPRVVALEGRDSRARKSLVRFFLLSLAQGLLLLTPED